MFTIFPYDYLFKVSIIIIIIITKDPRKRQILNAVPFNKRQSFTLLSRYISIPDPHIRTVLSSFLNPRNTFNLKDLLVAFVEYFSFKSDGITKRLVCFFEFFEQSAEIIEYLLNIISECMNLFLLADSKALYDSDFQKGLLVGLCYNELDLVNFVLYLVFQGIVKVCETDKTKQPPVLEKHFYINSEVVLKLNDYFESLELKERNDDKVKIPGDFGADSCGSLRVARRLGSCFMKWKKPSLELVVQLNWLQKVNKLYDIAAHLYDSKITYFFNLGENILIWMVCWLE